MPVPANIAALSTTAGSNSPPGSEAVTTVDDYIRAHASFIAQLRDEKASLADNSIPLASLETIGPGSFVGRDLDGPANMELSISEARLLLGVVTVDGAQSVAGLKTFSGGHLSTSNSQVIGYGTGAGGSVTQLTSKFTSVTINRPTGSILTHDQSLAAGASADFTVNNSTVPFTAPVVVAHPVISTGYEVKVLNAYGGSIRLRITNTTGGALAEAVNISFAVINGVVS